MREVGRLKGIKKYQGNEVNLVIDYHPALRCLSGILKQLQSMVNCSDNLDKIISKEPLICYRRPKTLKILWSALNCVRLRLRSQGF